MDVRQVDPRDITWERVPDAYRVTFWSSVNPAVPESMQSADEWRLSGEPDVRQVISWAERTAQGRTFTLYAEHPNERGELGQIHLAGLDPTRGPVHHVSTPSAS